MLKTDNGSAFIAELIRELLDSRGVLQLRSPARTPQYNGSCEAAVGSHRRTTDAQALLKGHHHHGWTGGDMQRSHAIRNVLGRPWRDKGPSPCNVWQRRKTLTRNQRQRLRDIVKQNQDQEKRRTEVAAEVVLAGAAQASIDRIAIGQALDRLGQLTIERRLHYSTYS